MERGDCTETCDLTNKSVKEEGLFDGKIALLLQNKEKILSILWKILFLASKIFYRHKKQEYRITKSCLYFAKV